jgi:transcriptional regulator with XRE-family HTH domain
VVSPLAAKRRSAGYSQEALAEALGKDRTTIGRWERGEVEPYPWNLGPLAHALGLTRDEVVELVARTRQSRQDAGDHLDSPWLDYAASLADTVAAIAALGRYDLDRRRFVSSAFAAAAVVGPSRDWLLATLDEATAPGTITTAQVDAIRRAWRTFEELGATHGGGWVHAQQATYVIEQVLPLVQRADASSPAGRALFEAVSEQLHLLAMSAVDNNGHGLAQGYLTQAVRLAQEARVVDAGAHAIGGLGFVALEAGDPHEATQLVRAGHHGLTRGRSNGCRALLATIAARASAKTGDRHAVTTSIRNGLDALDRMRPDDEPAWGRRLDAAFIASEFALAQAELGAPLAAVDELVELSLPLATERGWGRPVVYNHTARAVAAHRVHDLDQAATEATAALRVAAGMRSSRCQRHVTELRTALAPHAASRPVQDFLDQADLLFN